MNKEDFKKMYPNVSDEIIDRALDYPNKLAKELVSVQPMDTPEIKEALISLFTWGKSEERLIAEGYRPVCNQTRLMWVKEERVPPGEYVTIPSVDTQDVFGIIDSPPPSEKKK